MPPKKRDKPVESIKISACDQIQSENELFHNAFEKPTQIYRYLRTRHLISPLFLNRSLIYMKQRMSRAHKKRKDFKVNSIFSKLDNLNKERESEKPSGHMTLTFTGYYDKTAKGSGETVTIEAVLMKICHTKRKDVCSPVLQFSAGRCQVPRNPDPESPPSKVTALSVPSANFALANGNLVKSYVLLITVQNNNVSKMRLSGLCNGNHSDADEPPSKKRRNGKGLAEDPAGVKQLGAELIVYDKQQRCLLSNGEYQLVLRDSDSKLSSRKMSSWETLYDGKETFQSLGPFDVFKSGPLLTFNLSWNATLVTGLVDVPRPIVPSYADLPVLKSNDRLHNGDDAGDKQKRRLRIFYQFLYNNNTHQQTEARDDLSCPWCSLNCSQLYSLLKHLKLCHHRFLFTYVPHPKGARIDVTLNELYDGSYVGNPQDLHSHSGHSFSRGGPVRRTPVTQVLVCRPKRPPPSLSEFLEADETDIDGNRPYIFGHTRLYYHTCTCLPIQPQELELDSEGENDPEWLRIKTQHMIDEFTDVNEGEKELMKLWNLHIMKYGFVGDCQISLACSMFVEQHGVHLIKHRLYKNFILHLTNLLDFGLITASVVFNTVCQLQKITLELDVKPFVQQGKS